jgi:hypothetical protein
MLYVSPCGRHMKKNLTMKMKEVNKMADKKKGKKEVKKKGKDKK